MNENDYRRNDFVISWRFNSRTLVRRSKPISNVNWPMQSQSYDEKSKISKRSKRNCQNRRSKRSSQYFTNRHLSITTTILRSFLIKTFTIQLTSEQRPLFWHQDGCCTQVWLWFIRISLLILSPLTWLGLFSDENYKRRRKPSWRVRPISWMPRPRESWMHFAKGSGLCRRPEHWSGALRRQSQSSPWRYLITFRI